MAHWLTVAEAAERLNMSERTLRHRCRRAVFDGDGYLDVGRVSRVPVLNLGTEDRPNYRVGRQLMELEAAGVAH